MQIDYQEFRKSIGYTQAELAHDLNMKVNTYAMVERGARKMPKAADQLFKQLCERSTTSARVDLLKPGAESPDVAALLEKAQLTPATIQSQNAYCVIEIIDVKKKLQLMKRQFEKALEFVRIADAQLSSIPDKQSDRFKILAAKRGKAMKKMSAIIAQNPARMMVKLEMLKQEQIIFENALQNDLDKWLNPEIKFIG